MAATVCAPGDCEVGSDLRQLVERMRHETQTGSAVSSETVLSWAKTLESLLPASGELQSRRNTAAKSRSSSSATAAAAAAAVPRSSVLCTKVANCSFPVVADHGRLEVRQVSAKAMLPNRSLPSVAMCVYAILQTVLKQLDCEILGLYMPYRGSDCDFRLMCGLSRDAGHRHTGSTILRGTNLMEYACMHTGYVINIAPKTPFSLNAAKSQVTSAQSDPGEKTSLSARMCCPVRVDTLSAATGVISIVGKASVPFDQENENFVFDAALIIARLLQNCDDTVALQKCFSQGDYPHLLPTPPEADTPSRGTQLVYRANERTSHLLDPTRVVGKNGVVVPLREGSPIISVFQHMEEVQKAWSSSVKLNIELKAAYEKKDLLLTSTLTQQAALERQLQ